MKDLKPHSIVLTGDFNCTCQLVGHGMEQMGKTFMKTLGGNLYTIEEGIDDSHIIIN